MAKFRETWWSNSKKTPGQAVGLKDGQILFHRTFPATTGGPTSTTPIDRHLKVNDIEYGVGLTKNHCITVSVQKISSIHNVILKIQQILGSHELNGHTHFLTTPTQKSLNQLLAFLNLQQHAKNRFIPSIHSWDTVNFRALRPDWPHPFLSMPTQELFSSTFNLCEFFSSCKKSGYFGDFFWRYGWLKILQSDCLRTYWPISQERKFPQIWDLCKNTANNINFHYGRNSVKINDQIFQ